MGSSWRNVGMRSKHRTGRKGKGATLLQGVTRTSSCVLLQKHPTATLAATLTCCNSENPFPHAFLPGVSGSQTGWWHCLQCHCLHPQGPLSPCETVSSSGPFKLFASHLPAQGPYLRMLIGLDTDY